MLSPLLYALCLIVTLCYRSAHIEVTAERIWARGLEVGLLRSKGFVRAASVICNGNVVIPLDFVPALTCVFKAEA